MAKKSAKLIVLDDTLPQNILLVGEKPEEDKVIYISQNAYREIHAFTKNKLKNESGGMLIGNVIEAFGKTHTVVHGFVEAKYSEGTPTTLKFTHETWEYVHGQIEKKYENGQIIGWIHTHPDFGIFLSDYDKFIQSNFFKEEYQIAYVIDPIQHIEGFYYWINEKIEKCPGFYLFDKTGVKIKVANDIDNPSEEPEKEVIKKSFGLSNYIMAALLIIVVIVAGVWGVNLKNRVARLEKQQENLVGEMKQYMSSISQYDEMVSQNLDNLNGRVINLENIQESQEVSPGALEVQSDVATPEAIEVETDEVAY